MPVDRIGARAERLDLRCQRFDVHDRVHGAVALGSVDVDDDANRIQAVERECLDRFPRLALLELTVAHEDEGASRLTLQPPAEGDSPRGGQRLREGTGCCFETG